MPGRSRRSSKPDRLPLVAELLGRAGRIEPPGGCSTFVEHPSPRHRHRLAVRVGIVIEHRFAFSYWLKYKQELLRSGGGGSQRTDEAFVPPDLISMDWHDDCGCDSDFDTGQLARLNQQDENEVAVYCWAGLRSLNDGQMLPAMWLNAIGNAYIVQRQYQNCERQNRALTDRYGKRHHAFFFRRPDDLPEVFRTTNSRSGVIWDVDMDYFTRTRPVPDRKYTPPLTGREIRALLAPRSEWMRIILDDLKAITVALEPEYTGGLSQSLGLFSQWEKALFSASIFSEKCRWKTR